MVVSAQAVSPTEASWTDSERARATLTAGRLDHPVIDPGDCWLTPNTATWFWLPAPAPSVDVTGYEYRLSWDPEVGTGVVEVPWTAVPPTTTDYTVNLPSGRPDGWYTFELRSVHGPWTSDLLTGAAMVEAGALAWCGYV